MRTEKQILNNLNEILAVREETLENYTIYDMLKKGTEQNNTTDWWNYRK